MSTAPGHMGVASVNASIKEMHSGTTIYSGNIWYRTEKEDDKATALRYAPVAIRSPVISLSHQAFPIRAILLAAVEKDRKGFVRKVLIDTVDDFNLNRQYSFDVFHADHSEGRPIGRVVVLETDGSESTCKVEEGETAITEALKNGDGLLLISSYKLPNR